VVETAIHGGTQRRELHSLLQESYEQQRKKTHGK